MRLVSEFPCVFGVWKPVGLVLEEVSRFRVAGVFGLGWLALVTDNTPIDRGGNYLHRIK